MIEMFREDITLLRADDLYIIVALHLGVDPFEEWDREGSTVRRRIRQIKELFPNVIAPRANHLVPLQLTEQGHELAKKIMEVFKSDALKNEIYG